MHFRRRWGFFIDCLMTLIILMLKVPPNMLPENIEFKPPWSFLEAVLFLLLLCCVFLFHWSELYHSSEKWRQDLFQKWKLYWPMQMPSWLLSIIGLIRIIIRVIRLASGKSCRCYYTRGHMIFSSPEQRSGRAIVLHPASALALASASTNVKVFVKVFKTSLFPNLITDLIHLWYGDTYWSKILRSTIPTTLGHVKVKVTDLEFSC